MLGNVGECEGMLRKYNVEIIFSIKNVGEWLGMIMKNHIFKKEDRDGR